MTGVCPMVKLVPDNESQVTFVIFPELSVAGGPCQTAEANACPGWVFNVWLSGQTSKTGASLSMYNMHLMENH